MTSLDRHLETLELRRGASLVEIKQAYRDLAQIWHPDRYAHNPRLRSKAEERFKAINEAYQALISEAQRRPDTTPESRPPNTNETQTPPQAAQPPSPNSKPKSPAKRHWGWTITAVFSFAIIHSCYNTPRHPHGITYTNEPYIPPLSPTQTAITIPSAISTPLSLQPLPATAPVSDPPLTPIPQVPATPTPVAPLRTFDIVSHLSREWIAKAKRFDVGARVIYFIGSATPEPPKVFQVPAIRFKGDVLLLDASQIRVAYELVIPDDGSIRSQSFGEEAFVDVVRIPQPERLAELRSPTPTPIVTFDSAAEAQNEAVRRYPDLGVAGSKLNLDFITRYKLYQRERPEYFNDNSWPIHLAEESIQSIYSK